MSGIAGTIRNRNERLAAQNEQKDKQAQQDKENARQDRKESREDQEFKLNMAAANARMQNEQKLAHQTDAAPMIAANQKFVKMISNPDSPYAIQPIAEDQTYAQIQKGVVDGKWNTYEYSAYPTGTLIERGKEGTELAVPTGENYQDGGVNPTTTYTLFKFNPNQKVKFDDSTPEGKANIKFINNYNGANNPLPRGRN